MKTRIDRILFSLVAAVTLLLAGNTALASSRVLPFQGRLSDANGNAIPDGARVVQFKIYDAPVGGRTVWSGEVHKLTVNSGLVSTLLGTKATLAGVDFNQDLYLEITIDANADGQITLADPPLLPRQSILPAVFAQESANARLLGGYDWSSLFGTNNPADGILLASKIGDSSLATAKLADGAVSTAKLANGAVTPGKLNTSGAVAGQSLMFNGTQAIWNQVDALNAQTLKGYDWSSIFSGGNPAAGSMSVANFGSRGSADVAGDLVVSGRTFLNGPSTTIQGSLAAPSIGINMFMNDWGLFLRNPGDFNHYLKYGNGFGNQSGFDGPILEGNAGGVLGAGGNWTLRWNNTGTVQVRSTISSGSDRNLKEHFSPINSEQVLDKVLDLPVSTWNYKDDPSASHMGPVAQDFRAAFGLGSDDKSIAVVDADGVALAAIKGLHKKVQQEESSLRDALNEQQKQIMALKAELEALKKDR